MPKRLVASPRWTVAATAACLAAGAFLASAFWWDDQAVEPATPVVPATEQAAGGRADETVPGFALNPSEDYAEMVERPLFTRTRRPTPAEDNRQGGGAAGEVAPAAQIALNGILLTGKRRVALLRVDNNPKVMHVAEGQEAGGWLVEAIRPDRVILRRGETASEIALDFKRRAETPAAQPAVAQPRLSQEVPAGEDVDAGE